MYDSNNTKLSNGSIVTFGTIDVENISTLTSKTFTFKNEGTQTITNLEISTTNPNIFSVNNPNSVVIDLAVNASVSVTVNVKTTAPAGEYIWPQLSFKNSTETISGYINLRVTITEEDPYVVEVYNGTTQYSSTSKYDFGQAVYGGSVPAAHTFRIVNVGAKATGDLNVSLQYTKMQADAYTITSNTTK